MSEQARRDRRRSRERLTAGRGGGRRVETFETIKQQTVRGRVKSGGCECVALAAGAFRCVV